MQLIRHKCPKCGSDNILRSKRRGMIENFISRLGVLPYRCDRHICGIRFFIVFPKTQPSPQKGCLEIELQPLPNQINDETNQRATQQALKPNYAEYSLKQPKTQPSPQKNCLEIELQSLPNRINDETATQQALKPNYAEYSLKQPQTQPSPQKDCLEIELQPLPNQINDETNQRVAEPPFKPNYSKYSLKQLKIECRKRGINPVGDLRLRQTWIAALNSSQIK